MLLILKTFKSHKTVTTPTIRLYFFVSKIEIEKGHNIFFVQERLSVLFLVVIKIELVAFRVFFP